MLSCSADKVGKRVRCVTCSAAQVVPEPDLSPADSDDAFDGYAIRDEELPSRPTSALPSWLQPGEAPESPRPQRPAPDDRGNADRSPGDAAARGKASAKRTASSTQDRPGEAPSSQVDGWGDWGPPVPREVRSGEPARTREPARTAGVADDEAEEPPYGGEQLDLVHGVWTMPWQGDAALRWFMFAVGLFVTSWLALGVISMVTSDDMLTMVGGIAFIMPLIWFGVWTLSYGAACFLGILVDTANGARRVTTWPEGDWREWVFMLFQMGIPMTISLIAGLGLGEGAEALGMSAAPISTTVTVLLFPILLLSSLTENSVIHLVSRAIWGSLFRLPAAWLLTYLAMAVLVLPSFGLYQVLGTMRVPFLIANAVWMGAAWFILARVLGRLLCRIRYVYDDLLEDEEDNQA